MMQNGESFHAPAFGSVASTSETAANYFGVASAGTLMEDLNTYKSADFNDFLGQEQPNANDSIGRLSIDIVANLTHLNRVKEAAKFGKALHEGSEVVHESQRRPVEAVVLPSCQARC